MKYKVEVGDYGIRFYANIKGRFLPLLTGLVYQAYDIDNRVVFETKGATMNTANKITFQLSGPGADEASLIAQPTYLTNGICLEWTLRYSGQERKWNQWTSGFRFSFAYPITAVKTQPIIRWVKPTGEKNWEVPGDAPYPDTEFQLRCIYFGDLVLVMVWSEYDPDWIYRGEFERAFFGRFIPPTTSPAERKVKTAFLLLPKGEVEPASIAAEVAGRPVAFTIYTDRLGNLFKPGEIVEVKCKLSNVTKDPHYLTLHFEAWSYQGELLLKTEEKLHLSALNKKTLIWKLHPKRRGIIFISAILRWEGGETIQRTTIGILPERSTKNILPDSPFGLSAIIADPQTYPDQFELPQVLKLVERIGVRWLRVGFPIKYKEEFTPEEEWTFKEKMKLLKQYGISPHIQLGSDVPKQEERASFSRKLADTIEKLKDITQYIEVGNELNFYISATEYVTNMLSPINETIKKVFPEGKIMSMGLGGIQEEWLVEFVKAGGMKLIDILSVHPGCHPRAPEFWEGWKGWVFRSQMLDAIKSAKEHNKEVWITEAYAPASPQRQYVDLRTSADYMVRTYICALALGVKVVEWYQFQDGVWFAQRPVPDDIEYNFGLVYTDLTPKPAYIAYGVMTEQLEGAVYVGRLELGAEDLYGARFKKDGEFIDVLWSYREKHETDLPWWPPEKYEKVSRKPGEPWEERWREPVFIELPMIGDITVTDIMGNNHKVSSRDGKVTLKLTGSPIYVRGLGNLPLRKEWWAN